MNAPEKYSPGWCEHLHVEVNSKLDRLCAAVFDRKDGLILRVSTIEALIPEIREAVKKISKMWTGIVLIQICIVPLALALVVHYIAKSQQASILLEVQKQIDQVMKERVK